MFKLVTFKTPPQQKEGDVKTSSEFKHAGIFMLFLKGWASCLANFLKILHDKDVQVSHESKQHKNWSYMNHYELIRQLILWYWTLVVHRHDLHFLIVCSIKTHFCAFTSTCIYRFIYTSIIYLFICNKNPLKRTSWKRGVGMKLPSPHPCLSFAGPHLTLKSMIVIWSMGSQNRLPNKNRPAQLPSPKLTVFFTWK